MVTQTDSLDDDTQDSEPTLEEVHDSVRNLHTNVFTLTLCIGGVLLSGLSAAHLVMETWEVAGIIWGVALFAFGTILVKGERGSEVCQRIFDSGRAVLGEEPREWRVDPEDNERN